MKKLLHNVCLFVLKISGYKFDVKPSKKRVSLDMIREEAKKRCTYVVAGPTKWDRFDQRDYAKFMEGINFILSYINK